LLLFNLFLALAWIKLRENGVLSFLEVSVPLYPLIVAYSAYLFSCRLWGSKYVSDSGKLILGFLLFATTLLLILALFHLTKILDFKEFSE